MPSSFRCLAPAPVAAKTALERQALPEQLGCREGQGENMIVEFAGLPRSGKSSTVSAVRDYYLRCERSVIMSPDEARLRPFSSRHRVEFACWTANQALSSVLEGSLGARRDGLILHDRGLFDALAFFKLLHLESLISDETLSDFIGYFAKPQWTSLVDIVMLFRIPAEQAMERDVASRLGAGPGIITNIATMRGLSESYRWTVEHYGHRFPRIESVDAASNRVPDITRRVLQFIGEEKPAGNPHKKLP